MSQYKEDNYMGVEGYYDNYDKRRQFVSHLIKFDKDQMFEINLGHLLGLTVDQICLYARPQFNYLIMRHLKQAMIDGTDMEKVKFMANIDFTYSHIILIEDAFRSGLTLEEIKTFISPEREYNDIYNDYHKILDKKNNATE